MSSPEKFFLTTPIYYVNARPHIGHAYTTIVADVIARRHRLLGHDTWFLTGTDEHGQKIERSAAAAGVAPQLFTDQVSAEFRALWDRMGLTYDDYIRTTSAKHVRGAQKLFSTLHEKGEIYLSSYTGQYSIGEEMFIEGPPGTIGPDGKPTETVTEENFFFRLGDYQARLIDLIESDELRITPESSRNEVLSFLRGPVTSAQKSAAAPEPASPEATPEGTAPDGTTPEPGAPFTMPLSPVVGGPSQSEPPSSHPHESVILSEGAGSLTASAAAEGPAVALASTEAKIAYSAQGNPYLVGALRDLSVSRSSFTWGIPIPEPAASETKEKHVIYVWLDALANYMTAVGYGSDAPEDKAKFARYWPADLHLVGKEITRFHCVYWPAFLMAAGIATPKSIVANGWLLFDNAKMSKSRGNVVRTETILDAFGALCPPPPATAAIEEVSVGGEEALKGRGFSPAATPAQDGALAPEGISKHDRDLFASDVLRYFLLREIPYGQDGSFSFDAMITRYNADLANGYGNLVSRTLSMINKYFDGSIQEEPRNQTLAEMLSDLERLQPKWDANDIRALMESLPSISAELLDKYDFTSALKTVGMMVGSTDQMLTVQVPWKLDVTTPSERKSIGQILHVAAESIRIITALLYPILPYATAKVWAQLGLGDIEQAAKAGELANLTWGGLKPGTKLGPLSPIFPRADKGLAQTMADMEEAKNTPTPSKFVDETFTTPAHPADPTHPAAGPRAIADPAGNVAGSAAVTTERPASPSHTDAPASGIFAGQPAAPAVEQAPQITIDDFAKIELRVAKILVAERIPKADKLLRLEVDLGFEKRQILSGIAEWYTPEDLIGRRIVVITNLAPRKMRGLESHGMLLAASEGESGKPVLATFGEDIALGSRLK